MNGFLYLENAGESLHPRPIATLPAESQASAKATSFPNGGLLITWGNPAGDIHCSQLNGDSLLILCGYISEISGQPRIESQTQAATLLHQLLNADSSNSAVTALLQRVRGSFGGFYRDNRKGISLCLSDRIASRPLWKMRNKNGWIVSSHAMAIGCAFPTTPLDLGALGAFLLYAGPVEARKSLFSGITSLEPGSITKLGSDGAVEEHCWYRFHHKPDNQRSLSDWIDLAAERLVRSASRIAAHCDRPVVFFSGGVDSRLTAAALKAAGANPLLVTLGDARNLEVRVSEQAAKALGLEHIIIVRDKHWYLEGLSQAVYETGGTFLWTHGHFVKAIRQLREHHSAEVCLLGDFCEAFSKLLCEVNKDRHSLWEPAEFQREFDRLRIPLYRPQNRNRTLSLLNQDIRAEVEVALSRDITQRYERLCQSSSDPRIVADQFSRWNSAATIATFFMFLDVRAVAGERNLMFDADVHELLETLPSRFREGVNLGALLVKRLSPAAGRVVNSNTLMPICWPPPAHAFSKKCKPVLGKVRRLILGDSHRTTGAWPEKAALYASDPAWRNYFGSILACDGLFPEDIFDRNRVRQCWQGLLDGHRECAGDIEKLVQFGLISNFRNGVKREFAISGS